MIEIVLGFFIGIVFSVSMIVTAIWREAVRIDRLRQEQLTWKQ